MQRRHSCQANPRALTAVQKVLTAFITMFKKALGKPPAKYLSGIGQNINSAFAGLMDPACE
jgi:hypothetical protein